MKLPAGPSTQQIKKDENVRPDERSARHDTQPQKNEDHRVRVAAERRERMRARLLEAALVVFGHRGVEASVVDDITAIAGVSRGTFYNYFRTNEELMRAVALEAGNEVVSAIEGRFDSPPDAAHRLGAGVLSWLELVHRHPHIGAFFRRAGLYVLDRNLRSRALMKNYLPGWVQSGDVNIDRDDVIFDIFSGSVLAGVVRVVTFGAQDGYAEVLTQRILVALGISMEAATSVAYAPLKPLELPADSLIERSVRLFNSLPPSVLKQIAPDASASAETSPP